MKHRSDDAMHSLPTTRREKDLKRANRLSVTPSFASTSPSIYSPRLPSYPSDNSDTDSAETPDLKLMEPTAIRRGAARPKRSISPPHYDDALNILSPICTLPTPSTNSQPNHSSPNSPSTPTAALPPTPHHRHSNWDTDNAVRSEMDSQFDALLDQLCQQTTQILRVSRSILAQASTSRHIVDRINAVESSPLDSTSGDEVLEERMGELERDCDEWLSPFVAPRTAAVSSRMEMRRSQGGSQTAMDSLRLLSKPKQTYLPTPPISPIISLDADITASSSRTISQESALPRFDNDFDSSPSRSSNRPFRTSDDDQLSPLRKGRERSARSPVRNLKSDSLRPTLAPTTISASSSFSSLSVFSTPSPSIALPSLSSAFLPSPSTAAISFTSNLANRRRPSFTNASNPSHGRSHSHTNQHEREQDKIHAEGAILVFPEQEEAGARLGLKERLEKARGDGKVVSAKADEGGRGWFGW